MPLRSFKSAPAQKDPGAVECKIKVRVHLTMSHKKIQVSQRDPRKKNWEAGGDG